MRARHSIQVVSNFAWVLWVLTALGGFAWLVVHHPVFALAWLMAGFACLAVILPIFAINRRDD